MRSARVIKDYTAQYPNAPAFNAGDTVVCGKIDPEWPGWIWCTRVDGRSAWIPERIVARAERSTEGRTLEDYDSTELTAKAGETLVILAAESGWAWAENASGLRGWIPESYLD